MAWLILAITISGLLVSCSGKPEETIIKKADCPEICGPCLAPNRCWEAYGYLSKPAKPEDCTFVTEGETVTGDTIKLIAAASKVHDATLLYNDPSVGIVAEGGKRLLRYVIGQAVQERVGQGWAGSNADGVYESIKESGVVSQSIMTGIPKKFLQQHICVFAQYSPAEKPTYVAYSQIVFEKKSIPEIINHAEKIIKKQLKQEKNERLRKRAQDLYNAIPLARDYWQKQLAN